MTDEQEEIIFDSYHVEYKALLTLTNQGKLRDESTTKIQDISMILMT